MAGKTTRATFWLAGVLLVPAMAGGAYWMQSRRAPAPGTIAFVPQTGGAMLWDVEHFGATVAAEKLKCHLYWNEPTSETDVAGQVSLIDKISRGRYQGLVLAPNHPLAILSPMRRALAAGLPVVIVSAPLDLPANGKLGYIINDDEKMGEMAAAEVAGIMHGKGSIALVGLARYAPGVTPRVRAAERYLASRFPDIRVISRLVGAYNTTRIEELTNRLIDSEAGLNAVLSFTAASTRGAHAALKSRSVQGKIPLVGCEQDFDLMGYVGSGEVAAVVAENTYRMGFEAVGLIAASWEGKQIPARTLVPPMLITRQNLNSAEVKPFISVPR